jgi:hypothetical protein
VSRTREIKADELLEKFREVRDRGHKILGELEGQAKEVVLELVQSTTLLLGNERRKEEVRSLSERELDRGLERCEEYLQAISNAEDMARDEMPMPFDRSHLH